MNKRRLTYEMKKEIRDYIENGLNPKEIAQLLNVNISTIYRELKRGEIIDDNGKKQYCPDIAHKKYQKNLKNKGIKTYIEKDERLAVYIANELKNKKSPKKIAKELEENKKMFTNIVGYRSIYKYIEKGIFDEINI